MNIDAKPLCTPKGYGWTGLLLLGGLILMGRCYLSSQEERPHTLVKEAELPSGRSVRVELELFPAVKGFYPEVFGLHMIVDGKPVDVPDPVFEGFTNLLTEGGVQWAEFGRETYLLLTGGKEDAVWEAKITIKDLRVTQRTMGSRGERGVETRYPPLLEAKIFGPVPGLLDAEEPARK